MKQLEASDPIAFIASLALEQLLLKPKIKSESKRILQKVVDRYHGAAGLLCYVEKDKVVFLLGSQGPKKEAKAHLQAWWQALDGKSFSETQTFTADTASDIGRWLSAQGIQSRIVLPFKITTEQCLLLIDHQQPFAWTDSDQQSLELIGRSLCAATIHQHQDRKRKKKLKRVRKALEKTENLLELVFNHTYESMGLLRVESPEKYTIVSLNERLIKNMSHFGLETSVQDLAGIDLVDFWRQYLGRTTEECQTEIKYFQQVIKEGEPFTYSAVRQLPHQLVHTEVDLTPLPNDQGVFRHLSFIIRNVTERVEAERALQQSEQRMRLAVQNVPVMLDATDENGHFLVWNKECERVTGYSAKEIIGNPKALELLYPDPEYRQSLKSNWRKSSTDVRDQITEISCKDGSRKFISWSHRSFSNPIPGWTDWGIGIDITERHKAEINLQESNRRFITLLSNLPGVAYRCILNETWTTEFMSSGCFELYGYPAEAFYPPNNTITRAACIHPDDAERVKQEVEQRLKQRGHFRIIYRILTANKEEKWISEQGRSVLTSKNGSDTIEGFIEDITALKRSEEKVIDAILSTEDRERSRIAKEIHDNLQQKLITSTLNLNILEKAVAQLDVQQQKKYRLGMEYLARAIEDARGISHDLMPRGILDFGLVGSIQSLLEGLEVSGIKFDFIHNLGEQRLDPKVEVGLYRIVQEATNNIIRHSEATEANIQLLKHEEQLSLMIEDNGRGMVTDQSANKHGIGLQGMENRARALAGSFFVDSTPNRGTSIRVELDQ